MQTDVRLVDGLPVEGQTLDGEAERKRQKLTELVLREYEESGTLCSLKVREAVTAFEEYASTHVQKPGE